MIAFLSATVWFSVWFCLRERKPDRKPDCSGEECRSNLSSGSIGSPFRLHVYCECVYLPVVTIEGVVKAKAQEFPRSAYCKVTIVQMNVYVLQLHDMDTWMIS